MDKRFERTLSQILNLMVLIVFVTTLATINVNIWVITYIWAISFLIAWALMLIYALHVLFQSDSYGYSIFNAIITAVIFAILALPAILVLARFIPQLPTALSFGVGLLDQNNQFVIYTSLIIIYFFHLINVVKLGKKVREESYEQETIEPYEETSIPDEDEISQPTEEINQIDTEVIDNNEIYTSETKNLEDNENIASDSINISSEELEIGEKIVFESNIDVKEEYNIDNVRLVEDLTDEDIKLMKGDDNNG